MGKSRLFFGFKIYSVVVHNFDYSCCDFVCRDCYSVHEKSRGRHVEIFALSPMQSKHDRYSGISACRFLLPESLAVGIYVLLL